jgi:hypothetical protein
MHVVLNVSERKKNQLHSLIEKPRDESFEPN